LKDLDNLDKIKFETEEARNSLETFVYDARSKLEDNEDLQKFTNAEEKELLYEALQETGNWLYDEGSTALLTELKLKSKQLHSKVDVVFERQTEYQNRDSSVSLILGAILHARNATSNITNSHEVEEEEYAKFLQYLENEQAEIIRLYQLQQKRPLDQAPLFKSSDLELKVKEIEKRIRSFRLRPKRKPKVEIIVENATNPETPSDEQPKSTENENSEENIFDEL